MPKKSKDRQIQELKEQLECVLELNRKIKEAAEEGFFYSSERMMLEEKLSFYKSIAKANALALVDTESRYERQRVLTQQLYADNKRIFNRNQTEYEPGLNDTAREEKYRVLQEENCELKGKLAAEEINRKALEEKIGDLIRELVEYKAELAKNSPKTKEEGSING